MTLSPTVQNSILAALMDIDTVVNQDLTGPQDARRQLVSLTLDILPVTPADGPSEGRRSALAIDRKTRSLIFVSGTVHPAYSGAESDREGQPALRVSAVFSQSSDAPTAAQ